MTSLRLAKTLAKIQRDPRQTASAAGLRYVAAGEPGISRHRRGKYFSYTGPEGEKITEPEALTRIRSLVIPPAWTSVWICADEKGHLQATGVDAKGRKQYRYHPAWNRLRSQTKYFRLPQFAEALPFIRERLERDLKKPGFPYEKILALAVSIIDLTHIRIGNETYARLYGSFGLTTLRNKHVSIEGTKIRFQFKGKKGVYQNIEVQSRRLARLIQKCKEIPGKELFQYLDETGNRHRIGSADVNEYLRDITGMDFTAKDFRTWAGTVVAYRELRALGIPENAADLKKHLVQAVDAVAKALGNTRTVCKKYYIHPAVLEAVETRKMVATASEPTEWLDAEETAVRDLLQNYVWNSVNSA